MVRLAALLISSVAAIAGSTVLAEPGHGGDRAGLAALRGVNFVSACRFSHRAPDDPIVYPGRPGASHDHTFVGARTTNAFSTVDSLRASATTCRRVSDTAAYWAPTLLQNGRAVEPVAAQIYYRRRTLARVRPFPPGLKMIAGDHGASGPQGMRVTFWNCGVASGLPASPTVPRCPDAAAGSLRLHVSFPDCWDGVSLDSADHRSHMAYSTGGRCPATHPVAVPAISLILRYPTAGGSGVELASGGQLSGHADFVNAWKQGALNSLVNRCLNRLRQCGRGS